MPTTPVKLVEPDHPILHPALDAEQIEIVASYGRCCDYQYGDKIFEHGQRDAPFVVLKSGRVEIFECMTPGERRLIAHVIPGRFIGDLSMFTGEPTVAEAEASEACEALILQRPIFASSSPNTPTSARSSSSA